MKKAFCLFMVVFLLLAYALPAAAKADVSNHGNDSAGNGVANSDNGGKNDNRGMGNSQNEVTGNQSGTSPTETMNPKEEKHETNGQPGSNRGAIAANKTDLMTDVHHFNDNLNASLENETPVRKGWIKNENDVRSAVHALLAMENLTDGIGPQVSVIAREFNNSEDSSNRLEEQIQDRNGLFRFLFGGNATAGAELSNITAQNQIFIQQLRQLEAGANLDPDVLQIYQQQIATLQADQTRLEQLAASEKKDRGLLGWL